MLHIIVTGVNSESEYTFSKLYLQQDLGLSLKIYKKNNSRTLRLDNAKVNMDLVLRSYLISYLIELC